MFTEYMQNVERGKWLSCWEYIYVYLGGLTGKLTKCVQYGINDLYLYRPGFYVPDTSGSSCTVHKFVQVVTYRTLAK